MYLILYQHKIFGVSYTCGRPHYYKSGKPRQESCKFLTGRLLSTSGSSLILDTQRRLDPTRQIRGMNSLDHSGNSM